MAELPKSSATPEGWGRLAESLDADVDFSLAAALNGLAANEDPMGWETLERKLNPQAASDASLANTLNSLTPPVAAGSWASLEIALDDALGEDVDAVVGPQLGIESAAYPSGWAALAARLELIAYRRNMVGAWKVTEACLLLTMLLLFVRFSSGTEGHNGPFAGLSNGFPMEETAASQPEMMPSPEINVADKTPTSISKAQPAKAKKLQSEPTVQPLATNVPPVFEPSAPAENITERTTPQAILPTAAPVQFASLMKELPIPEPLDNLEGPIYAVSHSAILPAPVLELPEIDNSIPVRYYLNLFTSPGEINQVITPQSTVRNVEIKAKDRLTYSYSAGALLDISKGKDGLQVGAIYGRHAYTPSALEGAVLNCNPDLESCPEGYNKFTYHSISFPFYYERAISTRGNWRIAARIGMSMSVITQSEFERSGDAMSSLESDLQASPQLPPAARRPLTSRRINSHQVLDPEPGWFEGGSLLNNASFYIGTGLTVERSINPRWSLYLSPSYGRVIYLQQGEGVGPYNDRIHRASLRFGSRFLLSGK